VQISFAPELSLLLPLLAIFLAAAIASIAGFAFAPISAVTLVHLVDDRGRDGCYARDARGDRCGARLCGAAARAAPGDASPVRPDGPGQGGKPERLSYGQGNSVTELDRPATTPGTRTCLSRSKCNPPDGAFLAAPRLTADWLPPLQGRLALVTGSTRGIGLGIAEALATAGCRVILNGRGDEGRQLEDRFASGQARYVAADLRGPYAADALVTACEAEFGTLDILVNSAGVQHVAPVEAFPDDRWDEIIALNLTAAFCAARAAIPAMRRHGFGRIVNIASVHGLVASEGTSAHVTAKHRLRGLP